MRPFLIQITTVGSPASQRGFQGKEEGALCAAALLLVCGAEGRLYPASPCWPLHPCQLAQPHTPETQQHSVSEVPATLILLTELKSLLSSKATSKLLPVIKVVPIPLRENSDHTTSYFPHVLHLEPKIKIIEQDNIQGQFHHRVAHQERKPRDHWTKEFLLLQCLLTKWFRV